MAKFVFIYKGGAQPKTPEEGKAMMMRWKAWLEDNKDSIVEAENPLGACKSVSSSGVEDMETPFMGYSVLQADSMDAALELAKACPFVEMENSVLQVAEIRVMGA